MRQLNRLLALKVEKLERQLWSPKSERYLLDAKGQQKLLAEPKLDPAPAEPAAVDPSRKARTSRIRKGPDRRAAIMSDPVGRPTGAK